MRILLFLLFASLAAVAAAQAVPPAPAEGDRIYRFRGNPYRILENEGRRMVAVSPSDALFALPAAPPEEADAMEEVVSTAMAGGVTLWLRIDAEAARLGPEGNYLIFPVCSVSIAGELSHGAEERNCPPAPPSSSRGERLLAMGVAAAFEDPQRGMALLTEALAAPDLPATARRVVFGARAEAAEEAAYALGRDTDRHDRLLIEALADYRRWAELEPWSVHPQLRTGRVLTGLGAYDEAIAAYRQLRAGRTAADAAIEIGRIHRLRGEHRLALASLDELIAQEGPQAGMRYFYHRAWTLIRLGRFEEAAAAITEALPTQPDYPYAYLRRACAYAQLGRRADAMRDQQRGVELLRELDDAQVAQWVRREVEVEQGVLDRLRAGGPPPLEEMCDDGNDPVDRARSRSPLLPATRA